jgi:hypothetical protein
MAYLKAKAKEEQPTRPAVCPGFGSVPGIRLADDFDAP